MNRLTPLEIQKANFGTKWKGFDPNEVREFLSHLAEQVEEEARTRGEMKAQVLRFTRELEDYRSRADALNEALVAAQKTAEATIAKAEADAQRIVSEAQTLADRLLDETTRRAENVELLISQLHTRRRAARADLRRLSEVLLGVVADDESTESREREEPTVTVMRPRQKESSRA